MDENILDIVSEILGMNAILGTLPDKPDKLIALFEYVATPPEQFFDSTVFIYNVQARTRALRATQAYQMALVVQRKLNRYDDARLSILQSTPILDIGQDAHNPPRREYTVNFKVSMKE